MENNFKPEHIVLSKLLERKEFIEYSYGRSMGNPYEVQRQASQLPDPALNIEEGEHVKKALMKHSEKMALSLNKDGIFTIEPHNDKEYKVSLNNDAVVSKANFKELVKIGSTPAPRWSYHSTQFNKNNMIVRKDRMPDLFEINRKTLKYKQEDLKTILENRLAGTYSKKFDQGKTWNEGGIGDALGSWESKQPAIDPTPAPTVTAPTEPWSQQQLDKGLQESFDKHDHKAMDDWLTKGAEVDYQFGKYLEIAAGKGDLETVQLLTKHNASLHNLEGDMTKWPAYEEFNDYLDDMRNGALHMAARGGHTEVVAHLLDSGAKIDEQSAYGGFALKAASENGHIDTVKLLVDRGADVNLQKGAALNNSAAHGHFNVATYLLDHGAHADDLSKSIHPDKDKQAQISAFLAEYNKQLNVPQPEKQNSHKSWMEEQAAKAMEAHKLQQGTMHRSSGFGPAIENKQQDNQTIRRSHGFS